MTGQLLSLAFSIVYKYDFIPKPLTVDKGVNKVAFLLANTLVVSTSTSLEFLTNTADPGLWRGSLSESVLHAVTWKRFVSVGSWPAFPVTLDTKVRVVLHWRRPGAPGKFKGYDQILISPHNNNVLSQWQVMRHKHRKWKKMLFWVDCDWLITNYSKLSRIQRGCPYVGRRRVRILLGTGNFFHFRDVYRFVYIFLLLFLL